MEHQIRKPRTSTLVRIITADYLNGDPWPVMGLCDYLLEKGYTKERLKLFANRTLLIPCETIDLAFIDIGLEYVN